MKRGIWIMISGACMLLVGHFASQWILDSIPTINPSHSSMMSDAQYHMLDWSNQLSTISQWGIIILVIGGFVTAIDRARKPKVQRT
ncbi:MAG TPA: hypothetical protein VJ792_00355 [Candidatus Nitrosotalea sp.]|nr:hypothetical protein [Candidatus Nitrosotalea sp.]